MTSWESHLGYFVAHLDTLIPDPEVNVRPVHRSGVEKLKRLFAVDVVKAAFGVMGHAAR